MQAERLESVRNLASERQQILFIASRVQYYDPRTYQAETAASRLGRTRHSFELKTGFRWSPASCRAANQSSTDQVEASSFRRNVPPSTFRSSISMFDDHSNLSSKQNFNSTTIFEGSELARDKDAYAESARPAPISDQSINQFARKRKGFCFENLLEITWIFPAHLRACFLFGLERQIAPATQPADDIVLSFEKVDSLLRLRWCSRSILKNKSIISHVFVYRYSSATPRPWDVRWWVGIWDLDPVRPAFGLKSRGNARQQYYR